ncbi:MAG TPA: DcaP family trimeric outer membrane transporter [Vicinamibacterales bacterium]
MYVKRRSHTPIWQWALMALLLLGSIPTNVRAGQPPTETPPPAAQDQDSKASLEIYGFAMIDIGQNFNQIDPSWFDTMRITKLPSSANQFGEDNSTFAGVRQSRLGFRTTTPTAMGELKTKFEIDMFGTGVDSGQTTIRLRHAWGELGAFGAGQTDSPFTDPDVWPNSLEYWGPTGMVFFRNVQVRWTPMRGEKTLMFALERPGASGDAGVYADRVELQNIKPRFTMPDITGAFKYNQKWGYVRVGGALRRIAWDDLLADKFQLGDHVLGWGLNFSSNVHVTPNDVLRLQYAYGRGVENYMQDSPVDVGLQNNLSNPVTPVVGKPLPVTGIVAFLDHTWNARFSTAIGYSSQDIGNTDAQAPDAFGAGKYALGNLLYTPVPNVMVGGELQWGRRDNFSDGFHSDDLKLQFSFKYSFAAKIGG